ncbi:hypothetical protein D3C72_1314810 [compost metagenome]
MESPDNDDSLTPRIYWQYPALQNNHGVFYYKQYAPLPCAWLPNQQVRYLHPINNDR